MIEPPVWTSQQLSEELENSEKLFRKSRMEEPLEEYLEAFDEYQDAVEQLLEASVDLTKLRENALELLTDQKLLHVFRYLPGPPISKDDLQILAQAVLSPKRLRADRKMVKRVVDVILSGLDRRRFAWVSENREPSEPEKLGAVLASAALIAASRVSTSRRNLGKQEQEDLVREHLTKLRLKEVPRRNISTFTDAPRPGEFCLESLLGKRKADFVVGLWDKRLMPIECKVSNSATNSVKRLNNDAAAKAESWFRDFGKRQVVPCAVLSGVYKLRNLEDAQDRGLTLIWAHRLKALGTWISSTKRKG